MIEQRYPRVLVCSINAFSKSGSNGKVLSELFVEWDKECLAQFYIYNELPNSDVCTNYFRVTDNEVKKSFLTGRKYGQKVEPSDEFKEVKATHKIEKNALTYLCRDIVWRLGRWKSKEFWAWIEEFKPECILWQADNSSFMPKLVLKISKKYNIPIVVFNTENYYFKKHNYFADKKFSFVYPLYRNLQKRAFRKLMKKSVHEIYNSEQLSLLYKEEFKKTGEVLYQATSLVPFKQESNNSGYKFLYAGNLGLNRHKSLIEMAEALQGLSNEYYLDVYGQASEEVANELKQTKGIRYGGVISYEKVLEEIEKSDFLCHVESFEKDIVYDLQTAFSTKIADYLASGKCMILYADEKLACTQYALKNDCACVVSKPENLKKTLQELLTSRELQEKYKNKAVIIAQENHNSRRNSCKFKQLLLEKVCKETKEQNK